MPRDFSAQAAERGAAGYPLLAHENLYDWHDCEQRNRSRRSGATFYSQLTARLQSLSRRYTGPTGARTYKSVEARLLLRTSCIISYSTISGKHVSSYRVRES